MAMTLIKQQSQTKTVRCFQSHFKVKQIGSDFARSQCPSPDSECFLTVWFSIEYANLLILLARLPSVQAVLNISVAQRPFNYTRTSPKGAQKL